MSNSVDAVLGQLASLRGRPALLDTNVLLLRVVAGFDRALVERHRRTRNLFVKEDAEVLERICSHFGPLVTTPTVLAEASNLLAQGVTGHAQTLTMARLALEIETLCEEYDRSSALATDVGFARYGLTDCAVRRAGERGAVVVTIDGRLHGWLMARGVPALNFNYLRP